MSFRAFAIAAMSATTLAACSDEAEIVAPGAAASRVEAPGATSRAMYVMTNSADANEVVVHGFGRDGIPEEIDRVPTGGRGSGQVLVSDGSVVLTPNGRWLLVANAGSNGISLFRVKGSGVALEDVVASGGTMPVSIAVHDDLVYVLNAGVPNTVSGFRLAPGGELTPLPSSTRNLTDPDTRPTDIEFTEDGRLLVVVERGTARITTFPVRGSGLLGNAEPQPIGYPRPLGSSFAADGRLLATIESDAAPGGGLVSYTFDRLGIARPAGLLAPDGSVAPLCWLEIASGAPRDPTGTFVFTSSPSAGAVYTFRYDGAGVVSGGTLAAMTGPGSKPTHLIARAGILGVLTPGAGSVQYFVIGEGATLSPLAAVEGLPGSASGLAAH